MVVDFCEQIEVGSLLKFKGEGKRYTVTAFNDRYVIATKPFNLHGAKYLYVIVDFEKRVRGPDNIVMGPMHEYDTKDGAEAGLESLESGEIEISWRHRMDLDLVETFPPGKKKELGKL